VLLADAQQKFKHQEHEGHEQQRVLDSIEHTPGYLEQRNNTQTQFVLSVLGALRDLRVFLLEGSILRAFGATGTPDLLAGQHPEAM
jgi:hypothetical protein